VRGGATRRIAHKLGLLRGPERFEVMARLAREGPAPLVPRREGITKSEPLRIAVLIPDFHRGSGGLSTILALVRGLTAKGHDCSLWFEDPRRRGLEGAADVKKRLTDYFGPIEVAVHVSFESWQSADVVVATGWETVARALLLPGCTGRAYLVQDYEPDFFPASAERRWAEESYRQGLSHVTAGPWLAQMLRERFGAVATHLDLGVDHDTYRPRPVVRCEDTVVFYARRSTPRRAVPLGLLALAELHRRRNDLQLVLFGEEHPFRTSFPYRHAGILPEPELAEMYSEATVGVSLSLTNYSRVSQEMMACGLPCVELDTPSVRAALGGEDVVTLAPFDPVEIAAAIERLLEDRGLRELRSETARQIVAGRTWERAAAQFEKSLRGAVAEDPDATPTGNRR
jgi:glycosyltransferase involved in cell wall biosynthesis